MFYILTQEFVAKSGYIIGYQPLMYSTSQVKLIEKAKELADYICSLDYFDFFRDYDTKLVAWQRSDSDLFWAVEPDLPDPGELRRNIIFRVSEFKIKNSSEWNLTSENDLNRIEN